MPALAGAAGQHNGSEPRRQQQAVPNSRKRTAEGLHAELASLAAVAHWDPEKQRNLDNFFQRIAASSSGHGEKAPKRHKPEWSAGAPALFSVGHNKVRPAAANGDMPGFLRGPSPTPRYIRAEC